MKRAIPVNSPSTCPPSVFKHQINLPIETLTRFEKKGKKMANLRTSRFHFLVAFQFLTLLQTRVISLQYKVGDLDAWGIPTSANPLVYTNWSKNHIFKIGDSLLFLYPPSKDSLIQVTEQSFNGCNLTDPILYMNNGNSLFNITSLGEFYFTSGVPGRCEMKQKLHISVLSANGSAFSPAYGPSALPDSSPSFPTVFGSIPVANSTSDSRSGRASVFLAAVIGFATWELNPFIKGGI